MGEKSNIVADFGIGLNNTLSSGSVNYNYKFNGKELQEELGLNWTTMDFRNYDNALDRFMNPDKLSEYSMSWTPYRFAYNNPVFWSDPTGLIEFKYDENGNTTGFSTNNESEIKALMNFFNDNENASV